MATILGNHPSRMNKPGVAVTTTIISLVLWIVSCVGMWFLIRHNLEVNIAKFTGMALKFALNSALSETLTKLTLYGTLILGILELLLMIWPTLEYLFKFHNPHGLRDRYKWYVCPIIACILDLLIIVIADAVLLQFGWVTLIQIAALYASIFIPRLVPAFQPAR